MNKILVLGDSGVGKTSWLHAMNGRVPRNIFKSTHSEQFTFVHSEQPAVFVAVHASINNNDLKKHCKGAEGLIVLYNHKSAPLTWLRRIHQMYPRNTIPVLVCCHGVDEPKRDLTWLHKYRRAEHAYTCIERRSGILDCANRILTQVRRNLPSPLSENEMTPDE